MPARTLNDFFAGFFYGRTKKELDVDMAISPENENDRRGAIEGRVIAEKPIWTG